MTKESLVSGASVDQIAKNIPADAQLAEICVYQDVEGRWPVRMIQRDFRCTGVKEFGYMLCGDQMVFSSGALAALMRGLPGAEAAFTLRSVKFSPLTLLRAPGVGEVMRPKGKVPAVLADVCPSGVYVTHHVCLAEAKEASISRILAAHAHAFTQERTLPSRRLDRLAAFAQGLGVEIPRADDGQAGAALLTVRREASLLGADEASSAAREALSMLVDSHGGGSVLGDLDALISRLMAVRSTVERTVAGPVEKASVRDFDFLAQNGVPFRARMVMTGDSFGFTSDGRTVTFNDGAALVELFDARLIDTPHGEFTGARYEISHYEQALAAGEMRLSDQNLQWVLGPDDLSALVGWARAAVLDLDAPANLQYGPMESWDSLGKAVRGEVVYDVYKQEVDGSTLYAVRKEGEPIWPGAGGYGSLDALLQIKGLTLVQGHGPSVGADVDFGR
jgi:hypothetical protein